MRAFTLANALSLANAGTLGPFDTTATDGGGSAPAVFTTVGYVATVNDIVKLGGTPPTGFVAGTSYHVVSPSTDTYELSATQGGSAINGTGTGSAVTATIFPAAGGTGLSAAVDLMYSKSDIEPTDPYMVDFLSGSGSNTEATPAVFTWGGGDNFAFADGDPAVIQDGTVSTGFVLGTTYYVVNSDSSAGTYNLALTPGGDAINGTANAGSDLQVKISHNFGGTGVTDSPGAPFLPDYSGVLAVALSSALANVTVYVEGADALADGSPGSYTYTLNGSDGQAAAGTTLFFITKWPQWLRVRYVNGGGVGAGTAQVSLLGT